MNKRRPRSTKELDRPIVEPEAPSPYEEPIGGVNIHRIPCQICGKTFETKSQLDRHRETVHEHGTHERVY